MSTQSALNAVYLAPSVAKIFADRSVGFLRRLSSPVRRRFSHPVTQKRIILLIVCLALLLDNMLYMVIVPIIDDYFRTPESTTAIMIESATTVEIYGTIITSKTDESIQMITDNRTDVLETANTPTKEHFLGKIEKKLQKIEPVKIQDSKDGMMGLLFASKAIVQLCINPFTGAFIDRIGYITPLTMGLMVMFTSTVVFAMAESYAWLFIARSLQGFGSALADTSSFGLIAHRFQNEAERSKALGIALAFISFGSLVAPPFGGVLYEFVGKPVPFIILAITCFFDALLLLLVEMPSDDEEMEIQSNNPVGTPIYKLLMDPYIAIIAGSLTVANFPLAFLEPTIAEWMQETMDAYPWQVGLIWLPPFLPHVLGVFVTVRLSVKYFRYQWLYGAIGLLSIGISTITVPVCKSYGALILPLSVMCFGIALIDTALLPTLAFLVDVRHTSVYGSVYAIADISYSVAYALGPILAGQAVQYMGYMQMNLIIGLANILFTPLLFALRRVYDWTRDKSQRHLLLSNEKDPEGNDRKANAGVNGHVAPSQMDAAETIASTNSEIKPDGAKESEEKISLHVTNKNYNTIESSNEVIPTSINPRPRPRPRRISRDVDITMTSVSYTSSEGPQMN